MELQKMRTAVVVIVVKKDHDDFNNNHLVSKHLAENKEVRLAELFDLLSAEIQNK